MNDSEKLKAFAEMIAIPLSNTDNIKWPIRSGQIISYINDKYAFEFINDLKTLVNTVHKDKWKTAFFSTLSIWKISHHVINGLCRLGLDNNIIAKDILLMCNILDVLSQNSWVTPRFHRIISNNEIEEIYSKYIKGKCFENSSIYPLVSAFLWAYTDTLFFQGREICCERHGLYTTNSNIRLLFTDINGIDEAASCLWPDLYSEMGVKSIRVIMAYDEKFDITIDPYNNTDLLRGSFTSSCIGGALIIDNVVLSAHEAKSFFNKISKRIEIQTKLVNALSKDELIRKYIDIFWYRKKPLSEIVHNNKRWVPDKSIYQDVDVEKIVLGSQNCLDVASYDEQVRRYDYSKYI